MKSQEEKGLEKKKWLNIGAQTEVNVRWATLQAAEVCSMFGIEGEKHDSQRNPHLKSALILICFVLAGNLRELYYAYSQQVWHC